jgi:voltage-dependent calcium channel L type alpha-1D
LTIIDYILTAIFSVEATLKLVAFGFAFCGSTSYIRSSWNILDFFVVIITLISYFVQTTNLNSIKSLRLLKVLRPLRAISKNESLKVSIKALGIAISGIITIMIVSLLFYFVFGIISVNYFRGQFYDCDEASMGKIPDTKWECLNHGGIWKN